MKMKIKYCERCGLFLGMVNPRKKYCTQCKRDVSCEQKRARRKELSSGRGFTPVKTVCQWCGEPMIKTSATQKYHKECAKDAAFTSIAEHQRLRRERSQQKGTRRKENSICRSGSGIGRQVGQALWRSIANACNRGTNL